MSIILLLLSVVVMIAGALLHGKDWLVATCLITSLILFLMSVLYPLIIIH